MSVARDYFEHLRAARPQDFRALNYLADQIAALHKIAGVDPYPALPQGQAATSAIAARVDPPPRASWTVTPQNGHFYIAIVDANPNLDLSKPLLIQHELASGTNTNFDSSAGVTTFRLGWGQLHLDVIDPNVTKYWRIRSRYLGSKWNAWTIYSAAVNAGVLKTS